MRNSLVTRLALLTATITVAACAIFVLIYQRSTRDTFIESQVEVNSLSINHNQQSIALKQGIEKSFNQGGWDSVRRFAETQDSDGASVGASVIIIDNDQQVAVTTNQSLSRIKVNRDEAGAFRVLGTSGISDDMSEMDLLVNDPPVLFDKQGREFGRMIVTPDEFEPATGDQFAWQVWRSSAFWLLLTMFMSVFATTVLIRRSLMPLNVLASAARELQSGNIPSRVHNTGDAEFEQLFDAFNSATESIARTDSVRKQLISDIAHELRTPLTNLKGQLEAAEAGLVDPDEEFLGTLRSETRLLERLIEDFQQLAVFDAGQFQIHLQDVPLNSIAQNILAPVASKYKFCLECDIPQSIFVRADEERIRQVFMNLIENAVRHNSTGLKLAVSARKEANVVKIYFWDNGDGIPIEHQPFIFDRFYRVEKSRNRATGGSGLGLSIVKAILEAMSGSIHYVDDSSVGAKFEIRLPSAESRSAEN